MVKRRFVFSFFFFFLHIVFIFGERKILELIVSFPDDIEVSSGQLKRFNKSVIDPKCLLKVDATSFCFDDNLSFSSNIFSCILLFLFEKFGLHAFQNGFELQSTLSFSKYWNLTYLFRYATKFHGLLNMTMSLGFFDLFALFLRRDLVIICLRSLLLKWGFRFPRKIFVFLGATISIICFL